MNWFVFRKNQKTVPLRQLTVVSEVHRQQLKVEKTQSVLTLTLFVFTLRAKR